MSYSKVLKNMVADANITQNSLSEKCKELNAPISRGQLNKILGGKAPAPEEKVSRAIAKICNADERELVLEGYLDKAPKEFIDFLNVLQDTFMKVGLDFIENEISNEDIEIIREMYRKETKAEVIINLLDMDKEIKVDKEKVTVNRKDNSIELLYENTHYIKMEDDSMQDKIPKGSKIKLKLKEKYKNGDIVLVKVRDDKKPIVRVVFFIGRDICLYALNKKYTSLYLKNGEYQIISSVSSVEIKL